MLTFCSFVPAPQTMGFEELYEPPLQLDLAEKRILTAAGVATWLFYDGELIGETFGISPYSYSCLFDGEIEDCNASDCDSIYCYGTTMLSSHQGRGFAKLLKAYWLGRVASLGYRRILGHSTNPAIATINRFFGAQERNRHERWYDTERQAIFYELPLDARTTVQLSSGDCGIACTTFLMHMHDVAVRPRQALIDAGACTEQDGLSHVNLVRLLRQSGLDTTELQLPVEKLPPYSIVNYMWENDGHYGVLLKHQNDEVFIYNPAFGKIDRLTTDDFNLVFWSPRYGERWSVSCK